MKAEKRSLCLSYNQGAGSLTTLVALIGGHHCEDKVKAEAIFSKRTESREATLICENPSRAEDHVRRIVTNKSEVVEKVKAILHLENNM
jgi:hypothetical protein